jgi:uncharacterized protein involved in oxidation of intracellular sulfur
MKPRRRCSNEGDRPPLRDEWFPPQIAKIASHVIAIDIDRNAVVMQADTGGEDIMKKALFILNDSPYDTERCYNALRVAGALIKEDARTQVTVFLMADAVNAAKIGQKMPDGCNNVERMLKQVLAGRTQVLLCGTCMDERGLSDAEIMPGARRSTMDALAAAAVEADKVLVF